MSYKLVAIDMDGTLLTPELDISESTVETIKRVIDCGVLVTLSTGRMYTAALNLSSKLDLDVPIITCNGAMIKCSKTGNIYYERNIDKDISSSIISELQCSGMEVSIYVDDDIYTAKNSRNIRLHRQIDNASSPEEVENLLSLYSKPIIKILFAGSPNRLETTAEHLYHKYNESVNFYFSIPYFVEIVDKRSNKALALKFLSEHFNIDREDIIAIGDNYNDLDMIRYAGLGVAMGNAPDYLKNAANYVTHSNNSDGVAHVLQKFILNENIYA